MCYAFPRNVTRSKMSVEVVRNRAQIVRNAKAYEALVRDEVYSLSGALKKTALETITRTQSWIAVQDLDTEGRSAWYPVPQKWGGIKDVDIRVYENNRRGGVDLQAIGNAIGRIGCTQVGPRHPSWSVLNVYASDLGLDVRSGTTVWVIDGEELPVLERFTLDIITDLADARGLSASARQTLATRLVA